MSLISDFRILIRDVCFGIAATILALLPLVLAIDFGGVLWWMHFVLAGAITGVAFVTIIGGIADRRSLTAGHIWILLPLMIWSLYAGFQVLPLPEGLVGWLSPASVTAYRDWIAPFMAPSDLPSFFPISVSPFDSLHSVALLGAVVAAAWSAGIVFDSRLRVGLLLTALAVTGASVAAIGMYRLVFPKLGFWGYEDFLSSSSFATFVNRNNASLMLNIGFAASLGLLAWRLTALTGLEVDDPDFEFNDMLSLVNDRDSMLGVGSAVLCISGLLVSGSRGGLVAAIVGFVVAFGWIRTKRGLSTFPVVAAVIGICVAILLVPSDLSLESIQRLEVLASEDSSTLMNDGRLRHWPDGIRAAWGHFPAGSGLATYGDAVLPHQLSSPSSGFHHADNLWVELFTEQGLIGIVLACWILVVVVRALHHLGESADPIDQGLRVTGWFLLASVVVSQAFDFGLIVPANLVAVGILLTAIVARESAVGLGIGSGVGSAGGPAGTQRSPRELRSRDRDDLEPEPAAPVFIERRQGGPAAIGRHLFGRRRDQVAIWGLATFAILASLTSAAILHRDSKLDALVREIDLQRNTLRTSEQDLAGAIDQLIEVQESRPTPVIAQLLCELSFDRARLLEVAERRPRTEPEVLQFYRQSSLTQRRLRWDRDSEPNGELAVEPLPATRLDAFERRTSDDHYRLALAASNETLRLRPLAQSPRPYQVYLDFIHQNPQRTQTALEQTLRLFRNDAAVIAATGTLAAESGDWEIATAAWQRAVAQSPALTSKVLEQAVRLNHSDLAAIIPPAPENYRLASAFILQRGLNAEDILRTSLDQLACDTCRTQEERARCEELHGDIAYRLGDVETAFKAYEESLRYRPMNAGLRLKWIAYLRVQNQRRRALEEARKGRLIIAEDPRFTQVIEQMAAEDLAE